MPKRTLGRTGLEVTVLGYGAGDLRGAPRERDVSDEQAERILNAALDAGINYFETSSDAGLSEERIGKFIGHRRDEFYLCTKGGCLVGYDPGPGEPLKHEFTPQNIVAGVEQSLRKMRTDHIDVWLFHAGPSKERLVEHGGLQAVLDLKKQGKLRFIGMSSTLPGIKEHLEMGVFDVIQLPYSAFDRSHESIVEEASKGGAGVVARNGAAKGGPGRQDGRQWEMWQQAGLDELLGGMSRMEFTLRLTASHPDIDSFVAATIEPEHLKENVEAVSNGPLPADVYAEAIRRLAAAGSVPLD